MAAPRTVVIRGGHVLTMDPDLGDLPRGDVLLVDGRIAEVGAVDPSGDAEVIDATGAIVIPGLIDGHRHLWQSLLRGTATDWTLPEYMVEVRSMYCGCFDAEAAYVGNYVGGLESLAAGITTVVDHSHLQKSPEISDALAKGLLDSGVGGVFCYALQNVPELLGDQAVDADAVKDLLMRFPDAWHDENARRVQETFFSRADQRLRFGVTLPEMAPYLPLAALQPLLERASALDPFLVTGHWDLGGEDPVIGQLSDGGGWPTRTLLTHCNHLGDDDLVALARAGVGICTTPDIECGMGTGPLVARRFRDIGGGAILGTDLSSYARADILQQARLLLQLERALMAQASGGLPTVVGWRAREVLDLVTGRAAESIGLASEIGSLTPGKRGDVVVVRPDPLTAASAGDPASALLFYTSPAEVETVVVEGEVVKRDGRMVGVDLEGLGRRAAEAASQVRARYEELPREALQEVWKGMFS